MERKHVYYSLLVLESAALIYASLQPDYAIPTVPAVPFLRQGDLEHLLAYAVYGFLLERSLLHIGIKRHRYFLAVILASAFGAFTEALQVYVPGRFADFLDWVINVLGVLFGSLATRPSLRKV